MTPRFIETARSPIPLYIHPVRYYPARMDRSEWTKELRDRIRTVGELKDYAEGRFGLPAGTAEAIEHSARDGGLPFAATRSFLSLAGPAPNDPILAQVLPSPREAEIRETEAADPLGEELHSPVRRLVHQYRSRVLLRVAGDCPVFCRHCFRRSLLPGEGGFITEEETGELADYIAKRPEIREVLVSGGDPLTASDRKLEFLFRSLRQARPEILIRLCTRAPVTLPSRVGEKLVDMLRDFRPLCVVTQANHPAELGAECKKALARLVDSGIPVHSQTVLLRGVNDDPDILETLFSRLARMGVDPYYLFQGDLAPGTAGFRVPLSRGLALYAELRQRLSGIELPRYAVDAPEGGGKVILPEGILGRKDGYWILAAPDGTQRLYPEEV